MIRAALLTDLASLIGVELACFGNDAWNASLLEGELCGGTRSVLLSADGAFVVGYGSIMVVDAVADLQRIAILPAARRRGLGHELLQELLTRASGLGATRILLEVAASNAQAICFYESFGFQMISRRRRYYSGNTDALVMERALGESSGAEQCDAIGDGAAPSSTCQLAAE